MANTFATTFANGDVGSISTFKEVVKQYIKERFTPEWLGVKYLSVNFQIQTDTITAIVIESNKELNAGAKSMLSSSITGFTYGYIAAQKLFSKG